MTKGGLAHLAAPGTMLAVRATPRAAANRLFEREGVLHVHVTAPPADGAANAAILKLLARALALPKSRLTLVQGASGRDKLFRID